MGVIENDRSAMGGDEAVIEQMARAMCKSDGFDPDFDQAHNQPRLPGQAWLGAPEFKRYLKDARKIFVATRIAAAYFTTK